MTTLAERLGYGADDRLLIINCDDLGCATPPTSASTRALRIGRRPPAPRSWCPARGPARPPPSYLGEDVGVHLTLNAEYDRYRWGPITYAPSLLDGDGGFPRTHRRRVGPRRPRRGAPRAAGPRSSGPSCGASTSATSTRHMGTLQLRPEFFDVYLELAVDYGLPAPPVGRRPPSAWSASRSASSPPRRACSSPTTSSTCQRRRQPPGHREGALRPPTRRHRDLPAPGGRHPRAARPRPRLGQPGRRPPPARATTASCGHHARPRPACTLIGFRELRDLQRAG